MATPQDPGPAAPAAAALRALLADLGARKELRELARPGAAELEAGRAAARELGLANAPEALRAYAPGAPGEDEYPTLTGVHLHDMQVFVERYFGPAAAVPRFLLSWDTGLGKTMAAITVAQHFARQFAARRAQAPEDRPTIFVIGFTRALIQAEMLRNPGHGFITAQELGELRRLRVAAAEATARAGAGAPAARRYYGYLGTLKRGITDRLRGGYYQFYGYREFATRLFEVTPLGERAGVRVGDLFRRPQGLGPGAGAPDGPEDDPEGALDDAWEETDPMAVFVARIAAAERARHVRVNAPLLRRMRQGLIVADEIHNVYNVHAPNMYGVAIQYALDVFPAADAPRALFMSATPMSGSPAEVVDVLNLLVPRADLPGGRPLRPADLFAGAPGALRFRPGALDTVARLSAGRVSFMTVDMAEKDPRDLLFPVATFAGEPARAPGGGDIPYLRYVQAPLAPLQQEALAAWQAALAPGAGPRLPRAGDYALYDMVFPNPAGGPPLYSSTAALPIAQALRAAPEEWRRRHQVSVLPGSPASGPGVPVVSGDFLALPALARYSGKYARFVRDVHEFVRAGPGKMLAYHDRVQATGVALLAQVLRHNGLAYLDEPPGAATLCSRCGVPLGAHRAKRAGHDYAPARFGVVTGAMDAAAKDRAMAAFNLGANLEGHQMRVLLGSQVIIEGLNFAAVRRHAVLSVPRNVSTLVQILGRSSRRGSHAALPLAERTVARALYLSAEPAAGGACPPDRTKAAGSMGSYLMIQELGRALRRGAANAFLPQAAALAARPADLEGLPLRPLVDFDELRRTPAGTAAYYAHQHAPGDLRRVLLVLRILFERRPVWPLEELVRAVQSPVVQDQAVNPGYFTPGLVYLALHVLTRPPLRAAAQAPDALGRMAPAALLPAHLLVGGVPRRIVGVAGAPGETLYAAVAMGPGGAPVLDAESYLRREAPGAGALRVDLAAYTHGHLRAANFERRARMFEAAHAGRPPAAPEFRAMLVEYDGAFHRALLERLCRKLGARLTPAEAGALRVYQRFRVVVTLAQLRRADAELAARFPRGAPDGAPVGFVDGAAAAVFAPGAGGPARVAATRLGHGPRHRENGVAVGYMEVGGQLRFKVRAPLHLLGMETAGDSRTLARGAVCETRPREAQLAMAGRLLRALAAAGRRAPALPGRAPALKGLASADLCQVILGALLTLEEGARAGKDGMRDGVRWFYLFGDARPAIRGRA